jgi:hypothetical protein
MARHGGGERQKDPVVGLAVELVFELVWPGDPEEQATVIQCQPGSSEYLILAQ